MKSQPERGQNLSLIFASLAVALILAVLFACDQNSQLADSSHTATSFNLAATPAASEIDPTPTLDANCMIYVQDPPDGDHALGDAEIKRHLDCLATKVALTHAPTWTPGAPLTVIPQPSPTLQMDSLMPCDHVGGYTYVLYTCWRTTVGGQVVSIASGVESDGDPNQGVILIYDAPNFMFSKTDPDVYLTPIKVGAVEITSVTGTQFMLAQADPNQIGPLLSGGATVVFDIATRQFLSAQCGQNSSSCTPVPIGTTTPVSTPQPTEVATPPVMQTTTTGP